MRNFLDSTRRFFNVLLGALAMIAVALLSAFLTMRLAIHGREVEVPDLANLTVQEAVAAATGAGLNINLENRFYSTITPAGRVLSQLPSPGTHVRREWTVRITESMGPQKVSVPNVIGQTERAATVTIRRLSLDLGTVAYLPSPGPAGIVLTQTPTPAAAGIDGPRVSLLVSEPLNQPRRRSIVTAEPDQTDPSGDSPAEPRPAASPATELRSATTATTPATTPIAPTRAPVPVAVAHDVVPAADAGPAQPYVMPNLIGLTLGAASARVASMGLHITSMEVLPTANKPVAAVPSPTEPGASKSGIPAPIQPMAPIAPITLTNTVVSQRPAPGHRVTRGDAIHIALSH